MTKFTGVLLTSLCLATITLLSSSVARCQSSANAGTVSYPVRMGISPPLKQSGHTSLVSPLRECHLHNQPDQYHQREYSPGSSCEGIDRADSNFIMPVPDTNVAVGDTEVVEFVNNSYVILNKTTGALVAGPLFDGALFTDPDCGQGGDDVIVQWDKYNHVWLLSFHTASGSTHGPPLLSCRFTIAPGGEWVLHDGYGTATGVGHDYPKWGVWPSGYFLTLNDPTGVCAFDSGNLILGNTAAEICVPLQNSAAFPYQDDELLLPADLDSKTQPPTGQDEFFIGGVGQTAVGQLGGQGCYDGTGSCTKLYLYSMHINSWSPPSYTFTGTSLADAITVPAYQVLCPSLYSDCVPQPGSGAPLLEGTGRNMMYRFAYWNDGVGRNRKCATLVREPRHSRKRGRRSYRSLVRVSSARNPGCDHLDAHQPGLLPGGNDLPRMQSRAGWVLSLATDRAISPWVIASPAPPCIHPFL